MVGVDPSAGMIREATNQVGPNISRAVMGAEHLEFENALDVIFCNSDFQWFRDPEFKV